MKKFVLSLIAVVVAVAAFAQVTTSGVAGLVTDKSNQPLIGASVIAVHTPSGTTYGVAANTDGRYTIQGMRSGGPYKVTISYVGYQTVEYSDVNLSLGKSKTLNVQLSEGQNIEEVVIAVSAFDSHATGASTNFTSESITSTPTVSRSVYDIVELSPLANNSGSGISFAGSNNRYNSFQIDGAVSNDVFGLTSSGTNGGSTGSNPVSIDALEQIQVVIAPFDVRQGGFTGGGINAITKSGTNTIKGSAYAYYTDENLYGTTAGELADGQTREKADKQTTSIMGVTVGGPIIKDKLFAFVSFERSLSEEPVSYNIGNDDYVSSDIVDQVIDKYYEKTGIKESYGNHTTTKRQSYDVMARIDYNISDIHKLMFRYQFKNASDDAYGSGYSSYTLDNSSYSYNNQTQSFVAELNSRLSNEISNEFRAGYTRVRDYRGIDYLGPRVAISNVDFNEDGSRTGSINIGTEINSGANALNQDVFTITDNVSYFKGDHTFTFGTHNEIYSLGNTYIQYSTGSYAYASLDDFLADNAKSYSYAYATECDNEDYMPTMNAAQFGLYAQDEWKPNTKFTLTYGLRVDLPVVFNSSPVNETFNNDASLTNNGEYLTGRMPDAQLLWSPRVGFRYEIDDEGNQLLRGGTGIFSGRVPFVWMHNAFSNSGVDKVTTTMYSGMPALGDEYDPSNGGTAGKLTVNTIAKDFKMPQVFRTNLGYEHIFDGGWKVTLEALYSKTLNNVAFNNVALTDEGDKFYSVTKDAANDANTSTYYSINSDYEAIVNLENTNKGYSYNLSAMVEKSFDFGLNLMASYTFGHSYSVNDGTSSVAYSNWKYNYSINTNDMNELSYAKFDIPHRINASVNYTTPLYGNGKWSTNVGLTYNGASGFRYSYVLNDYYKNINGDSYNSNTLLYIPTDAEIDQMSWKNDNEDRDAFKEWIANDKYASSHRGQYSERYAGLTEFEHHFNLHVAQNFIYNKERGSRIEVSCDIMNIGNLLNRNWGMTTESVYNLQPIAVNSVNPVEGGYEATYTMNSYTDTIQDDEYDSRWYMQIGARVTF